MKPEGARYVVAFNRDRDFYQVPWALAEQDMLDRLFTDLYVPDFLADSLLIERMGLAHRHCRGIPSRLVTGSLRLVARQIGLAKRAKTAEMRSKVFEKIDSHLSRLALARSRKTNANLFLYSGYAYEAFRGQPAPDIRKILFVYHPQGEFSKAILDADLASYPEVRHSHTAHMKEIDLTEGTRFREEIRMADVIVCASSFTRESVRRVLDPVSSTPVHVVPYGCIEEQAGRQGNAKSGGPVRFLFVGQGMQRKGLHHLIRAWMALPAGIHAELTLVANNVDPGILGMIKAMPNPPRMLSALSRRNLQEEFDRADVFVMPSLVEGFGLVYLEALTAGCFVVGSRNSGLPDLHAPPECCAVLPAGDVGAVGQAIQRCVERKEAGALDPDAIKNFARTRTWASFRAGIRKCMES